MLKKVRKYVKKTLLVGATGVSLLGGVPNAAAAVGDLDAANIKTEITAAKEMGLAVLGGCVAVWGIFILAKVGRRASNRV